MYYSCVALQITYYTLIFFVAFWAYWSFGVALVMLCKTLCTADFSINQVSILTGIASVI